MALLDELRTLGVNVDEGLDRVMGDKDLYEMMLGMFIDSVRDNPVDSADFDAGDLEALIKRIHMLKGVTGNLSIIPLFNAYTESLGLLRAGKPQEAKKAYAKLAPIQEEIVSCIKRNKGA